MSKPETNIISVPLANAYLNLNQEKDEIRQYEGFNKLNAPFYGGNLSPMYKKFLGASGASSYTDEDENVYTIENGVFTKKAHNGNTEVLKDDFQTYTAIETIIDNRTYKWYFDNDNYAAITDTGSVTVVLNGVTVGTYNNFEKILFDSDRALIVLSTSCLFIFEGVLVTEINKITERYIDPTYTIFNAVMVISLNNKLYGFYSDGTVNELTVTYNGNIEIDYTDFTLVCDLNSGSSEGDLKNNLSTHTITSAFESIEENTSINGEQSEITDSDSTSIGAKLKAWQINTMSSSVEWLYNGDFAPNNDVSSGYILSPFKSKIMFPATLCVSVGCIGNISARMYMYGSSTGTTYSTSSAFYSYVKTYNLYKITNAEINSISENNIIINIQAEKVVSIKNRNTRFIAVYTRDGVYSSDFVYAVMNVAGKTEEQAHALLTEYKNLYVNTSLNRVLDSEITGNITLGELKEVVNSFNTSDKYKYTAAATGNIIPISYTTPFYIFNLSYIENAQEYDLNTTRGYALNIADYFRVLVNNDYISAISMFNDENCLGTLISNFGTTGIEYFYAVTNNKIIYVDDKNKVHIIDVIAFSGHENMTVLLDRYFVFNAIGVNCYDKITHSWARIGLDWNNRFTIADYSESADTQYYMTSAMFRTTDNTPTLSMLFNVDYLNKLPYTSLTPQFARDAVIQLYGTTDVNDSALYLGSFTYSSDEWSLYNDSTYDGMIAESNSDNNLLIPVSLFTTYITSYLNDIYAVMSDGFTPLYKNDNIVSTIKFNYYIGSLIQDLGLDAIFIIQGQYYRLSNKIIYAYSYSGGVLVDTQEICNVGSLVFVGASPSEAFFWSYANRTLYRFTGARNVESVVCADSITTIYATLYDTTTSSLYLSTNLGLVVYNAFGNFILEGIGIVTELTSTKLGITYKDENKNLYGLYYNAVDGEEVIPVTLETSFYGSSSVQNVINDTLYLKIFNKDNISKGVIKFGGYIQQNYGETKEIVSKVVEVSSEQFDKVTNNLLLRYQPDKQRGIGISWKIESDFPISFIGIGSSSTGELNVPKSNNPVITTQKYNI